jgi:hypothetical protein
VAQITAGTLGLALFAVRLTFAAAVALAALLALVEGALAAGLALPLLRARRLG